MPGNGPFFNEGDHPDEGKSQKRTGDNAGKNPGGVHDVDPIHDEKPQSPISSEPLSYDSPNNGQCPGNLKTCKYLWKGKGKLEIPELLPSRRMIRIHPFHLCGAHRGKGFKGGSQHREENTDDGGHNLGPHPTPKDDHNGCGDGNEGCTVENHRIRIKHLFQRSGPEKENGGYNGRKRPENEPEPR